MENYYLNYSTGGKKVTMKTYLTITNLPFNHCLNL